MGCWPPTYELDIDYRECSDPVATDARLDSEFRTEIRHVPGVPQCRETRLPVADLIGALYIPLNSVKIDRGHTRC